MALCRNLNHLYMLKFFFEIEILKKKGNCGHRHAT